MALHRTALRCGIAAALSGLLFTLAEGRLTAGTGGSRRRRPGPALSLWPTLLTNWLRGRGLLVKP